MSEIIIAIRAALATLVLTGILYPLAVTGAAQLVFPDRANGSIVTDEHGRAVGSELIGQAFTAPAYLHPRPSAGNYDATASGGTNLSTTSKQLRVEAGAIAAAYRTENDLPPDAEIPADAATRSASGLDPDISPDNAALQAGRIARARGVAVERVRAILDEATDAPALGVIGEARVNVLLANLALDRTFGRPTAKPNTLAP